MNRLLKPLIALSLISLTTGCSFFRPVNQTLHVDCAQSGVKLKVNGEPHACPAAVDVRRNQPVAVLATKDGFPAQQRTVNVFISTLSLIHISEPTRPY